jgi:hypothetical protein
MPVTILTPTHYNAVRGLIAPDVTADHISDDYLSQQPFAPDAEREVRKRLRAENIDVDALTGEPLEVARLAMMHQCASELCVVAAQILQSDQIEVVTRVQEINWQEKRAFHLAKVTEKVSDVVTEVQASGSPVGSQTKRRLPFAAVGTERPETEVPRYPSRRVDTYND